MVRFEPRPTTQQQQQTAFPPTGWGQTTYPIHKPLAIYGRQSTKNQAENNRESYEAQTTGLLERAKQMGWNDGIIIIYTENKRQDGSLRNASGRLRIDQREGLSAVVERIQSGEIGAVMVYQEDRLFRDETGIQYNVFIDVCKRNHVLVITPMYTYDFNNDRYAVRIFRDKMQQAADFYQDYSKRMLHLRSRVSARGEYDGRGIPVGYTVDRTRNSPTYRKFTPYAPHAEQVRGIFARFKALCGNFAALCRELEATPFLFPDFEGVDERTISKFRLSRVPGGYHISRTGLKQLLTNVAYVGWWTFQGQVVERNNHEPIVDEQDFWYAFQRMSPYDVDGTKNNAFPHTTRQPRSAAESTEALLVNVIQSQHAPAYVFSQGGGICYGFMLPASSLLVKNVECTINISILDDIFTQRLLDISVSQYIGDAVLHAVQKRVLEQATPMIAIEEQLTHIRKRMSGLTSSLQLPEDILDQRTRIEFAQELRKLRTVESDILTQQQKVTPISDSEIHEYKDTLNNLPHLWRDLPLAKKRKVIELLVEAVTVEKLSPHWYGIRIDWSGFYGYSDIGYLYRGDGASGKNWTPEEVEQLRILFPAAPRMELLEAFPTRSWSSIQAAAKARNIYRTVAREQTSINRNLALLDLSFMQTVDINLDTLTDESIQCVWNEGIRISDSQSGPTLTYSNYLIRLRELNTLLTIP